MQDLVDGVILSLQELFEEHRKEFARKTHPTAMRIIGVTNPNSQLVVKELTVQTSTYTVQEKINLVHLLFSTNIFECQYVGLEFLKANKKALLALTAGDITKMFVNMDNWVSTDTFAITVTGFAWREGIISTQQIESWAKSKNVWTRRIALVSTVALNLKSRGGKGDVERTLRICSLFIHDHQEMIIKALSWALRELAKRFPSDVNDFLQKNKSSLHKRVIREVTKKLETGLKN